MDNDNVPECDAHYTQNNKQEITIKKQEEENIEKSLKRNWKDGNELKKKSFILRS